MESIYQILFNLTPYIHFIAFGLLMIAGLNIPISEDMVFLISAALAATVVPENTVKIFIGCYLGAYFSDLECYTLGRFFGRKILQHRFFKKLIPDKKIVLVENYFHNFGMKTLLFGRFIPFGIRNAIFFTAGIGRMRFHKFALIDLAAASLSSALLFYIGYSLGDNYELIFPHLKKYKIVLFSLFCIILIIIIIRKFSNGKRGRLKTGNTTTG